MIGSTVIRIRDGQQGTIVSMDDREVVVRFAATGETRNSPYGEYADAGETHHVKRAFFARFYKVYEVVQPPCLLNAERERQYGGCGPWNA